MDQNLKALKLINAADAAEQAHADELWSLVLGSPEHRLAESIEKIGLDPSEARQVLTDARIGEHPALLLIVLGRGEEVRNGLLRMTYEHH